MRQVSYSLYSRLFLQLTHVSALAWSQSGDCLATGSDDKRVILWRMGSSEINPYAEQMGGYQASFSRGHPELGMAQSDVIETVSFELFLSDAAKLQLQGHRANSKMENVVRLC